MARAKRTHRAEARRHYRDQVRLQEVDEDAEETTAPPGGSAAPPRRPGLFSSFRLPNVREDIRALPDVARHSPGFWLPGLLIAAAFVVGLDRANLGFVDPTKGGSGPAPASTVLGFFFEFVLRPPAMGLVFVAGILASRAQWLVGGIVGLVAVVAYYVLGFFVHGELAAAYPIEQRLGFMGAAAALNLPFFLVLGGLGGWYRRWLRQTSERNRARAEERRRQQAREARQKARPAPSRR